MTSSMPSQPVPHQLYQAYQYPSSHRYDQGDYASHTYSNISVDDALSYATRSGWSMDGQQASSGYDSSNNSTPYSEYCPSIDGDYYTGSNTGQIMGYPESSQRTHVPEGTYSMTYPSRYFGTTGTSTTVTSSSPHDDSSSLRFPNTTHSDNFVQEGDTVIRAAPSYFSDPLPAFERPSHSLQAHSRTNFASQLGDHVSTAAARTSRSSGAISQQHVPTQSSFHSESRNPPRTQAVPLQSRLFASGKLGEPGHPSLVPALIFDGDLGEEYDDESECSLPSAASEIYQPAYPSLNSGRQQGSRGTSRSDNSVEFATVASSHGEMSSPVSPSLSTQSSPRMTSDRPSLERSKSLPKKSKMHQCTICSKWFPRPSGLATHMNSHSGAKPYKCPIPSCTKSFAVRSNAKRHLRTHGIFPSSEHSAPAQFQVGFDAPIVSDVHEVTKLPTKLRWVPQSLATRTNVEFLRDAGSDSEDEYPTSCPVLSIPLPAVVPTSPKWGNEDYEDRNSYEDAGPSPYIGSQQWRSLPGPAIINPTSF